MLLSKWSRRARLALLKRSSPGRLRRLGERRALAVFRDAARRVPGYARLLRAAGVRPEAVGDMAAFRVLCPVLSKESTFGAFAIEDLVRPGALDRLSSVLPSSGHGSRFAFGLTTRERARRETDAVDLGLQAFFGVDRRRTMIVNCLPMGVQVTSRAATVANVSVREDMALALAANFGPSFEQVVFLAEPLFLKRLLDLADELAIDWSRLSVSVILGEDMFGERFRGYAAERLGIDLARPATGLIGSSLGVGELGLNLFHETPATIALRRAAGGDAPLQRLLFGGPVEGTPPFVLAYNPLRCHVEVEAPDALGFGALVVTLTEPGAPLPLVRYRTGDRARSVADEERERALADRYGGGPDEYPLPWIAFAGRLDDDGTGLDFRDALYADAGIARRLSGAIRLGGTPGAPSIDVQLARNASLDARQIARLRHLLPGPPPERALKVWPFEQFPHGMTFDYERKFDYVARATP